MQMLIAFSF